MEDKSLLELVNSALEMLTEVKKRLENGEDALTKADEPSSDTKDAKQDDWKPVDFFDSEPEDSAVLSPGQQVSSGVVSQPASEQAPVAPSEPQPSPKPQPMPQPNPARNSSVSRGGITLEFGGFSQTITSGGASVVNTVQSGSVPDNQPAISAARRSEADYPAISAARRSEADYPAISAARRPDEDNVNISAARRPEADYPAISAARRSEADYPAISAARRPEADQPAVSGARRAEDDQPAISAARRPGTPPDPANGTRNAKRMADAAAMAAQVCNMWKFQDTTDRVDESLLRYAGSEQDAISSLSIVDPDSYYIVSPEGALGITEDGGENINWLYLPVDKKMADMPKRLKKGEPWPEEPQKSLEERARTYDMPQAPSPQGFKFCKNCGTAIKPTAKFCKNCGSRVE